jgi:hypothetical protein
MGSRVRVSSNMRETILWMLEELKQYLLLFMHLVLTWNVGDAQSGEPGSIRY